MGGHNDINRNSMVLDTRSIHLKYTIPLILGREMGYNLKSKFSINIILSEKLNAKMTAANIRFYGKVV